MPLAAKFADNLPDGDRRGASRHSLRLLLSGPSEDGEDDIVLVHNLSRTGMLLQASIPMEIGQLITVELPKAGPTEAEVVWASGQLAGCRFLRPISTGAVSAAQLQSQEPAPSGLIPVPADQPEGRPAISPHTLRALRESSGLSVADVAEGVGVSRQTVWYWERGRNVPSPDHISRLANVLGFSAEELGVSGIDRRGNVQEVIAQFKTQIALMLGLTPAQVRVNIDL